MTAAFDQLKDLLAKQGKLTDEDIEQAVAAQGTLTDEERLWLSAEQFKLERADDAKVTMEEYLEASNILDTAAEGSVEYNKALKIVEAFESGG